MSDQMLLPVFNIERFAIHDGPGIRTTVFLQGCPLRCAWCANPESQTIGPKLFHLGAKCVGCGACVRACPHKAISISETAGEDDCDGGNEQVQTAEGIQSHLKKQDGHRGVGIIVNREKCVGCGACTRVCPAAAMQISGKWMGEEEIYEEVMKDEDYYRSSNGGVTFSGGEALLHYDKLEALIKKLKQKGISVAVETCGQVARETFQKAIEEIDFFLFDMKTMDREMMERYVGGDRELICDNLSYLAERHPEKVVVRIPVIPGINFDVYEMRRIFSFVKNCKIQKVELLPYHTLGLTKYEQLGREYPFKERKALQKEDLKAFKMMGQSMGLHVKIV